MERGESERSQGKEDERSWCHSQDSRNRFAGAICFGSGRSAGAGGRGGRAGHNRDVGWFGNRADKDCDRRRDYLSGYRRNTRGASVSTGAKH